MRTRYALAPLPLGLSLLLALAAAPAVAQTTVPPTVSLPPGQYQAVRTAEAPDVDGRLDDAAWASASPIEGFTQREPEEGAPASQRTVVHVLYDDNALYVGARMHDTAPDSIVARLGRRDADVLSDYFLVCLDPYHDRRSGFYFGVNAGGTLYDGVLYNDGWDDNSWDGVWTGRAARDGEGWTAELRIPYSQLRFRPAETQVWGINFRRDIARRRERSYLRIVPSTENGFVSHFPDLVGIEAIRPARGFEVVPYVTSRAAMTNPPDGNPFDDGSELEAEAGADFRVGLTSNLTLNATVNPDFGQVEVDPAVVNLSAFETFFEERRPFFVEGSSIFDFGYGGSGNNFGFNWVNIDPFYSRRIGRPPTGPLPGHDYAERPDAARILGATKLTGRLGATSVGVLSSLTGRSDARITTDGAETEVEVEPLAHYGVARALREFDDGAHGLGGLFTATHRDIRDSLQLGFFNSAAYVAGVDGWTRFADGTWVLKGWGSVSRVEGSEDQIGRLQRTAVHYLQRPDRESFRYDPTRTSLTGFAGRVALDKVRGNWMVNIAAGTVSPTYDLNDVGFLGRTDLINGHAFVGHFTEEPGRVFRNRTLMAAVFGNANYDGDVLGNGFWARANGQLLSYWYLEGGVFLGFPSLDAYGTRGGPLMRNPGGYSADLWVSSDGRKPWQVGFNGFFDVGPTGPAYGSGLDLTWQPKSNINVSAGPSVTRIVNEAQYITTQPDPLATATYDNRYVFAHLDQWEAAANIRVNWTFSPTMSFQLFAQPLLASGAYDDYKELAAPRTYDFNPYTILGEEDGVLTVDPDGDGAAAPFTVGRPDFRFASLRGNAVFRWEYRPGSTLYLVWTQQREDFEPEGRFLPRHSLGRLMDARPDNVFALKLTYWLGR
jgi:hypothetical protein